MHFKSKVTNMIAVLFAFALLVVAGPLWAQNNDSAQSQGQSEGPSLQQQSQSDIEVNDEELEKFAQAMKAIQQVQQSSNQQIEEAFSDSSLSKKRFNEMYQARRSQDSQKVKSESEQEASEYKAMVKQIKSIQASSQQKMVKAVKNNGISVQRFNQLVKAMRSDQELSQRLQQYM